MQKNGPEFFDVRFQVGRAALGQWDRPVFVFCAVADN